MTARLLGIARHGRPHGPMETLGSVDVSCETGVAGDYRGALKPGRNKRQVTLFRAEDWQAALACLDLPVEWQERRANLLVAGIAAWPPEPGTTIRIGETLELAITGECDPCARMDALQPGLRAALKPGWRGGVTTKVVAGGNIRLGDDVSMHVAMTIGSKA